MQVVAEGVERPAQLEFLAQCGPIGVQGYLLAYPVEASAALEAARAAAERARSLLETADKTPHPQATTSPLVFVGRSTRKRSN